MLVFVCLCACFVSACLLSGVPGGDKAGFPTEAVDCRLFCFYRCSSWLSGFSFSFCSVSSSLSLFGSIICCILYTKINKWAVDGHQSKSVWHKRYSDYNSAAMMLDRTRGEKKTEFGKQSAAMM